MQKKKVAAIAAACLLAITFSSCAVRFDYEMESESVVGEQVSSAKAWDNAFTAANDLAEKEGARYMMIIQTAEGRTHFNGLFQRKTYAMGYYSEGVLEGKAQGKLSYSYNIYESKFVIRMMDLGTRYRQLQGGRVIDIVPTEDGTYVGTDIGTDMLADAIPIGWTLFSVGDNLGDAAMAYENATYSTEKSAYCMSYEGEGYKETSWIWIVDGVVKKVRKETKSFLEAGAYFYEQEECIEVYVGGMNGTVEIPEYTLDGTI